MANTTNKYAGLNALSRYLVNLKNLFVQKSQIASASAAGITKLYTSSGNNTDGAISQKIVTELLAAKAPLESPAFTGTPTAPTAAATVINTNQVATINYVNAYNDKYVISDSEILTLWGMTNSSEKSY